MYSFLDNNENKDALLRIFSRRDGGQKIPLTEYCPFPERTPLRAAAAWIFSEIALG
jgi:hypothetical protein